MTLLSQNQPGRKQSQAEWWEQFLRSARLDADPTITSSGAGTFGMARAAEHLGITIGDPLLRHIAAEASRTQLHYVTAGKVVVSNARAKLKRV